MNVRYLWVSLAATALLTAASVCQAQEAPVVLPPADSTVAATPAPKESTTTVAKAAPAPAGAAAGLGSVGGMLGASTFYSSGDLSSGAQQRLAFSAAFRYTVSSWLRWQLSPGFTWSGYGPETALPFYDPTYLPNTNKSNFLTLLLPTSAQIQLLSRHGQWLYHLGAGPGFYRLWIEQHREVLQDIQSKKLHRAIYPGVTAELGAERFLRSLPMVSVEGTLTTHYVLSKDESDFPLGFNTALGVLELRVGANYHFALNRPKKPAEPALTAPLPPR